MELQNIISDDMSTIWQEVGGQDGMYENFPIIRFYRGDNNTPYRVYALDSGGGVAIISYINKNYYYKRYKIVTLGEDDGFHFLNGSDLYCDYFGEKKRFFIFII